MRHVFGRIKLRDDPGSLFLFGVSYAICSLACTRPVRLASSCRSRQERDLTTYSPSTTAPRTIITAPISRLGVTSSRRNSAAQRTDKTADSLKIALT